VEILCTYCPRLDASSVFTGRKNLMAARWGLVGAFSSFVDKFEDLL